MSASRSPMQRVIWRAGSKLRTREFLAASYRPRCASRFEGALKAAHSLMSFPTAAYSHEITPSADRQVAGRIIPSWAMRTALISASISRRQ